MKLLVTSIVDTELKGVFSDGDPQVGLSYELTELSEHSAKQRKLFHPLCRLYYNSGCYSYKNVHNWLDLRDKIKRYLGAGFDRLIYSAEDHAIVTVKYEAEDEDGNKRKRTTEEIMAMIPEPVLLDFGNGNKRRLKGELKSFADYTRHEVYDMTNALISEMLQNGVQTTKYGKKFNAILDEIGWSE